MPHYTFTEAAKNVYGIPVPADWRPPFGAWLVLHSLSYDANGGSGSAPPPITQAESSKTQVAENPFIKSGQAFSGWNTAKEGTGTDFSPGDTCTFTTADTTLYAQWEDGYTLSYDANGGSGSAPDPKTGIKDTQTTVEDNPFTRSGYGFDGWNTAADGSGTVYAPGDAFTFTENTILHAQWKSLVRSVTVSPPSLTLYEGASYVLTATVTPAGTGAKVAWTSSDVSIATVTGGKVHTAEKGRALITAEAGGKKATCAVTVAARAPQPTPTATPAPTSGPTSTPTATSAPDAPTPSPTSGPTATNAPDAPTPAPTSGPSTAPDSAATDAADKEGDSVVIIVDVSALPEGAAALKLPDGEVVEIGGERTLRIEIDKKYIGEDGTVKLGILDGDGMPLGVYTADSRGGAGDSLLIWVLIAAAGLGIAGFILWRRMHKEQE